MDSATAAEIGQPLPPLRPVEPGFLENDAVAVRLLVQPPVRFNYRLEANMVGGSDGVTQVIVRWIAADAQAKLICMSIVSEEIEGNPLSADLLSGIPERFLGLFGEQASFVAVEVGEGQSLCHCALQASGVASTGLDRLQ